VKHRVKLALRKPTPVQRLWYWRLGVPTPAATTNSHRSSDWVRLLPCSWEGVHQRYARRHGYFWLPCVLCGKPYGGHQSGGSIPDPTYPEHSGRGITICPRCTRAGRSWRVAHPLETVLDEIHDEYEHGHDPMLPDCAQCLEHDTAIRDAFANWPPHTA
jgi:hypothetical protein